MRRILGVAKGRAGTARRATKGRRGRSRVKKGGGLRTMARRLTGR